MSQIVRITIMEAGDRNLIVEIDPGRAWPTTRNRQLDVDKLTRPEAAAIAAAQFIGELGDGPVSLTMT